MISNKSDSPEVTHARIPGSLPQHAMREIYKVIPGSGASLWDRIPHANGIYGEEEVEYGSI